MNLALLTQLSPSSSLSYNDSSYPIINLLSSSEIKNVVLYICLSLFCTAVDPELPAISSNKFSYMLTSSNICLLKLSQKLSILMKGLPLLSMMMLQKLRILSHMSLFSFYIYWISFSSQFFFFFGKRNSSLIETLQEERTNGFLAGYQSLV